MVKTVNLISWTIIACLGTMTVTALIYAAIQIASGNYHSTASFEF